MFGALYVRNPGKVGDRSPTFPGCPTFPVSHFPSVQDFTRIGFDSTIIMSPPYRVPPYRVPPLPKGLPAREAQSYASGRARAPRSLIFKLREVLRSNNSEIQNNNYRQQQYTFTISFLELSRGTVNTRRGCAAPRVTIF